jgi:DNA polymerase-4
VQVGRRRGSIGSQRALGRRPRSAGELDAVLVGLVDRVAGRLRAARRVCRTVVIRLRFADFTRATRSHTFAEATAQTSTILLEARGLLREATPLIEAQGLTLLGISLANLADDGAVQLALALDRRRGAVAIDRRRGPVPLDRPRPAALDATVDDVRDRFGKSAITRAVLLGRDEGITMPMLPD